MAPTFLSLSNLRSSSRERSNKSESQNTGDGSIGGVNGFGDRGNGSNGGNGGGKKGFLSSWKRRKSTDDGTGSGASTPTTPTNRSRSTRALETLALGYGHAPYSPPTSPATNSMARGTGATFFAMPLNNTPKPVTSPQLNLQKTSYASNSSSDTYYHDNNLAPNNLPGRDFSTASTNTQSSSRSASGGSAASSSAGSPFWGPTISPRPAKPNFHIATTTAADEDPFMRGPPSPSARNPYPTPWRSSSPPPYSLPSFSHDVAIDPVHSSTSQPMTMTFQEPMQVISEVGQLTYHEEEDEDAEGGGGLSVTMAQMQGNGYGGDDSQPTPITASFLNYYEPDDDDKDEEEEEREEERDAQREERMADLTMALGLQERTDAGPLPGPEAFVRRPSLPLDSLETTLPSPSCPIPVKNVSRNDNDSKVSRSPPRSIYSGIGSASSPCLPSYCPVPLDDYPPYSQAGTEAGPSRLPLRVVDVPSAPASRSTSHSRSRSSGKKLKISLFRRDEGEAYNASHFDGENSVSKRVGSSEKDLKKREEKRKRKERERLAKDIEKEERATEKRKKKEEWEEMVRWANQDEDDSHRVNQDDRQYYTSSTTRDEKSRFEEAVESRARVTMRPATTPIPAKVGGKTKEEREVAKKVVRHAVALDHGLKGMGF